MDFRAYHFLYYSSIFFNETKNLNNLSVFLKIEGLRKDTYKIEKIRENINKLKLDLY